MNTPSLDQHWFISLNGKRYGPYTFAALVEAAAKGVTAILRRLVAIAERAKAA